MRQDIVVSTQSWALLAAACTFACQTSTPRVELHCSLSRLDDAHRRIPSEWPTYGANQARTSVNLSYCRGPLAQKWRFEPESVGERTARAKHVVVDHRGVFVAAELGESTTAYRLNTEDGSPVWTFDSRTDIHHAHWPTLSPDWVVLNDDGLFVLSPDTGDKLFNKGLDWWGQTLVSGGVLYMVNTYHVHGPKVFVGALNESLKPVWKRNVYGTVAEDYLDRVGAIALDSGTLFQAIELRWGGQSGLFAFDASTGDENWFVATHPSSAISAGGGSVFGVELEEASGATQLVARDQRDGQVVWKSDLNGTDEAAPVVAGDHVLTFSGQDGTVARNAKTGVVDWREGAQTDEHDTAGHATHIAVAWLSRTVVVAAGEELWLYDLDDGAVSWQGSAPVHGESEVHSPVLAQGVVYVVESGAVHAFACAG